MEKGGRGDSIFDIFIAIKTLIKRFAWFLEQCPDPFHGLACPVLILHEGEPDILVSILTEPDTG